MKYLYALVLLVALLNLSCTKYEFDNPVDPAVTLASPGELSYVAFSEHSITLSWKQIPPEIKNIEIEQSTDNKQFVLVGTVKADSAGTTITGDFLSSVVYYFRIRGMADNNFSAYSETVSAKLVLDAPYNLKVTDISESAAMLQWQSNLKGIAAYEIERSTDGINFDSVKTVSAIMNSAPVEGEYLTTEQYYFRIRGKTKLNTTDYSNVTDPVQLKFDAPANLTVSAVSDELLKLQWQDNSTFETAFVIEMSTDGINYTAVKETPKDTKAVEVNGKYLLNTSYFFRVKAKTSINSSAYSNTADIKLKLDAPSNLTVKLNSDTKAELQWKDNSSFETGFEIECSKDGGNYKLLGTALPDMTGVVVDGTFLTTGTYQFRVRVKTNHNYSQYSNTASANLTFDGPSDLSVKNSTATSVQMQWKDNSGFETGFDVERSENDGAFITVAHLPLDQTSYMDLNLNTASTYTYRIKAVSLFNQSNASGPLKVAFSFGGGTLIRDIAVGSGSTFSVSFRPDGKFFATGSDDGKLRIWELCSGNLVRSIQAHSGWTQSVCFSPDGSYIATVSTDGYIKIWSFSDGTLVNSIKAHNYFIREVKYSPDGQLIMSASGDATVKIWSARTLSLLHTLSGHSKAVDFAFFSPDGKYIISLSEDELLKIWLVEDGSCISTIQSPSGQFRSASLNPEVSSFVTGDNNGNLRMWDFASSKQTRTFAGHSRSIETVSFSPNGDYIASGSSDFSVKIWKVSDGSLVSTIKNITNLLYNVSFSPDGNNLVTSGLENSIRIFDVSTKWHMVGPSPPPPSGRAK